MVIEGEKVEVSLDTSTRFLLVDFVSADGGARRMVQSAIRVGELFRSCFCALDRG